MPELLWKSYIDFEISQKETHKARILFERLLERTAHVKVFISFAQFEATAGDLEAARGVFDRGYKTLRENDQREECLMLLEAWEGFEESLKESSPDGNAANIREVAKLMPKKLRKKREIKLEDGSSGGWEEYFDIVFPDDEKAASGLKFLQNALAWKTKLAAIQAGGGSDESAGSESAAPAKRKAEAELQEEVDAEDQAVADTDGNDGDDDDDDEIDLGDL